MCILCACVCVCVRVRVCVRVCVCVRVHLYLNSKWNTWNAGMNVSDAATGCLAFQPALQHGTVKCQLEEEVF